MYKARTSYRQQQDERLRALEQQLATAQAEAKHWREVYDDLRDRALKSYHEQQAEIAELKRLLQEKQ
jgi:hypothetical protein